MATKKTTTTTTTTKKEREQSVWKRAAKVVAKGGASAAGGALVGVVEEAAGERAGLGTRAVMAAAGVAGQVLLDPEENPVLADLSRTSMDTASAITGYKAGRAVTRKGLDAKEERDQAKMLDRLKADMEDPATETDKEPAKDKTKQTVTAKKRTTKKVKDGQG